MGQLRTDHPSSEAVLRAIVAGTVDALWVKDRSGRYLLCNGPAAELAGKAPEEMIGLTDDAYPAELAARFREQDLALLCSGAPIAVEEETSVDGVVRRWLTTKAPFHDESGRVAGIVGIARDITARREAEQALAGQTALLHDVFEGTTDCVFVKDKAGRYVWANSALSAISGKPLSLIVGMTDVEVFPPDSAARFMADDRRIMASGAPVTYEERVETRSGPRWHITMKGPRRDAEGRVIGVVGISRDITERAHLLAAEQAARREAEAAHAEAERAARRLTDLLAITEAALGQVDMDALFGDVAARLRAVFGVDTAAVILLSEDGSELVIRASAGLDEEVPQRRFSARRGLAAQLLAGRKAVIVDELRTVELASPFLLERGVRSFVGVPLRVEGRVLGLAHIATFAPRRFTPEDAAFLQLVADRIAVAIDRVRLFEAERRARAQAEAAEERARLQLETVRDVTQNLGEGVFTMDTAGRVTFMNPAAQRILGFTEQELLGQNLHERVHFQRADGTRVPVEECPQLGVLRTGVAVRAEDDVFTRKDGSLVPISAMSSPIVREGRVEGVVFSFYDISGRKRAERAQQLLSEASLLLASSLDIDVTLDRVAHLAVPELADLCVVDLFDEDGRVRCAAAAHVDPAKEPFVRELFPPEPQELYEANPLSAAMRDRRPALVPEMPPLEQIPNIRVSRLEPLRALGIGGYIVVPLVARGHVLGGILFVAGHARRRLDAHDLALAKELGDRSAMAIDSALLYQKATEASRAREELLAVVSHDLRSPLTTIVMGVRLLEQVLPEGCERARRQVGLIERASRRMSHLVRDLLDAARIEAGHFGISAKLEEVGPLVGDVVDMHAPIAEEKGVRLEPSVKAGVPAVVCDRDELMRVLANLVGNAIRFTPEGGRVLVSVDDDGNEVRFSVADTGPGIGPEQLAHLFDRYWQARAQRGGAGLGLYIAKGIVEAHGGRIWVDSRPGAGATFSFAIAAAARCLAEAPAA